MALDVAFAKMEEGIGADMLQRLGSEDVSELCVQCAECGEGWHRPDSPPFLHRGGGSLPARAFALRGALLSRWSWLMLGLQCRGVELVLFLCEGCGAIGLCWAFFLFES